MAYNVLSDMGIPVILTMIHSFMPQEEEDIELMHQKGRFNMIKSIGEPNIYLSTEIWSLTVTEKYP